MHMATAEKAAHRRTRESEEDVRAHAMAMPEKAAHSGVRGRQKMGVNGERIDTQSQRNLPRSNSLKQTCAKQLKTIQNNPRNNNSEQIISAAGIPAIK